LLIGRLGRQEYAVPVSRIERVLRMAALVPLPEAPASVAGLLDLHGDLLPVVDPRPAVGQPPAAPHPDQRLIVIAGSRRYALWVDGVERIVAVPPADLRALSAGGGRGPSAAVAQLAGSVVPVLSPEALDPGPIVGGAS
jgi:chemotaxis signal transduction protein